MNDDFDYQSIRQRVRNAIDALGHKIEGNNPKYNSLRGRVGRLLCSWPFDYVQCPSCGGSGVLPWLTASAQQPDELRVDECPQCLGYGGIASLPF